MIEWERMAVPQTDQYDTETILRLAQTQSSPLRSELYVRRPVGDAAAVFDGQVAVRYINQDVMGLPNFVNASQDHPNIPKAATYVQCWPEVYEQFKKLIDTVHPFIDTTMDPRHQDVSVGSSSNSNEHLFGTLCATVNDPIGLAQAMVHEMAHQKLRAMGISVETATRLIVNPPDDLYESPIRKDRSRPMTAVFHAQYSFMHVTQLDIKMLEHIDDEATRDAVLCLLARNVIRMEAGHKDVAGNIQTDADGKKFIGAFLEWSEKVLLEGNAIMDKNGYGACTLQS